MASPYKAPRFNALFRKLKGRPMFLLLRSQWEAMKAFTERPVQIDISETPLARLATEAEIVAAVAERRADYEAEITIYRRDPKDPRPIKVDRYLVWERVPDHRDFPAMLNAASTCDNSNMRGFLVDHVFLVKEEPGSDHWLSELPQEIAAAVKRRS